MSNYTFLSENGLYIKSFYSKTLTVITDKRESSQWYLNRTIFLCFNNGVSKTPSPQSRTVSTQETTSHSLSTLVL